MRKLLSISICASALTTGCVQLPPVPILPPNTSLSSKQIVVLDIDGTLTPHNLWVFEARPDSDKVIAAFVRKGYKIVYVTTRVPGLQAGLASWLRRQHLPIEPIHIAQTRDERNRAAAFKENILQEYLRQGWTLAYAYGDSATDFSAYSSAGIPQSHIYGLKRRGSDACEGFTTCLDGWTEHIRFVENQVTIAQ